MKGNLLINISSDFYAFVSGALISIPMSLLLEIGTYYKLYWFWIGLTLSIVSSFLCFKFANTVNRIQKQYAIEKEFAESDDKRKDILNNIIKKDKKNIIIISVFLLISFLISMFCIAYVQFI